MIGGHANADFAQWTSDSTPHIVTVVLGYVPDFAEVYIGIEDTNSDLYEWANIATFSQWVAAADALLTTGSTGVRTLDSTNSPFAYAGGDTVTATDVTNGAYRNRDGAILAAGVVTQAGISIPAGAQSSSSKNFLRAYRAAK